MNSRLEFNEKLLILLTEMTQAGEHWLIDFVKRSPEEQKRLFDAGLSKCDGVAVMSWHNYGRAVDLYFQDKGMIVDPIKGYAFWHSRWEELGGHKMIEWDRSHWEG
jgi:hypothetical protein